MKKILFYFFISVEEGLDGWDTAQGRSSHVTSIHSKTVKKGSGAKSYIRRGFLIYEEMLKNLAIYGKAVSHIWLCTRYLLNFVIFSMRKIFFSFLTVYGLWFCSVMWSVRWAHAVCGNHNIILHRKLTFLSFYPSHLQILSGWGFVVYGRDLSEVDESAKVVEIQPRRMRFSQGGWDLGKMAEIQPRRRFTQGGWDSAKVNEIS
jgi:hypothetical protein